MIIVMSNFRSSSVADQAMDVIITLLKPKYQEIEGGSRSHFLLFGKKIVLRVNQHVIHVY